MSLTNPYPRTGKDQDFRDFRWFQSECILGSNMVRVNQCAVALWTGLGIEAHFDNSYLSK